MCLSDEIQNLNTDIDGIIFEKALSQFMNMYVEQIIL